MARTSNKRRRTPQNLKVPQVTPEASAGTNRVIPVPDVEPEIPSVSESDVDPYMDWLQAKNSDLLPYMDLARILSFDENGSTFLMMALRLKDSDVQLEIAAQLRRLGDLLERRTPPEAPQGAFPYAPWSPERDTVPVEDR
jgi:RecB family endonuclease NucS